ncbi:MAG: bifunctional riboflavin kinase/FAD synthetase [Geitlerinemataceae cyanobacterium]
MRSVRGEQVRVTSSLTTALVPTTVALGNFDGVHQGHRQVIGQVLAQEWSPDRQIHSLEAQAVGYGGGKLQPTEPDGETSDSPLIYTTVVTFDPHPQEFFSGQPRTLLTPGAEKAEQLEAIGVDQLVLLPFDRDLAQLEPQAFVEEILVRQLQAKRISVGQDFHFGRKRAGTAIDLQTIAANYGIDTTIVPLYILQGERVSSSNIRQALTQGNLETAHRLLGRSYSLTGTVVQGQQLGRTLGFPTANLQMSGDKFLPRWGVYSVWVDGLSLQSQPGVMNIGCRPTVLGDRPTVEVYLLDWSGDLYGQTLTVRLAHFLRPEAKFDSLDALKAQIQRDCEMAKSIISNK